MLGGGKRIRPTFAWWGWRGAGGDPDAPEADAVLRAVSALELIQACALDPRRPDGRLGDPPRPPDRARRVRPPARRGAAGAAGRRRFGAAAAILLGDLALAWADDMLRARRAAAAAAAARRAEPWQAMRTEVLGGQYLDVLHQATGDALARAPRCRSTATRPPPTPSSGRCTSARRSPAPARS